MASENSEWWNTVSKKMQRLLDELKSSDTLYRDYNDHLPAGAKKNGKGIYVFYEDGKPIYVGRTDRMRNRLYQHGQEKSGYNSAPLANRMAYRVACPEKSKQGYTPTKAERERIPDFQEIFYEQKPKIRKMGVRIVEVKNPEEQALFEVYAAVMLETTVRQGGYNDFKNH